VHRFLGRDAVIFYVNAVAVVVSCSVPVEYSERYVKTRRVNLDGAAPILQRIHKGCCKTPEILDRTKEIEDFYRWCIRRLHVLFS